RSFAESQRISFSVWPRIEVHVPIRLEIVIRPFARQQTAGVEIDDVGLEGEADVRLYARALELMVAGESKDVVADNVRLAVVLVKPSVSCAIDHVVFGHDAAAAFIKINPPAAVTRRRDIMPQVVV